MVKRKQTRAIHKSLSLKANHELPADFQVSDSQWRKLSKEVPIVVKMAKSINPDIKDSAAFRGKVQKGLLLRLYEIQVAAQKAIKKQGLQKITLNEFRKMQTGEFISITGTGSIHYFCVIRRHLSYMECSQYDRQSYYNLELSEQTKTNIRALSSSAQRLQSIQKIRIQLTKTGQLQVSKGFKTLSGKVDYKKAFTSSRIKEIFMAVKLGAASQSFSKIADSIHGATQYFMMDLTKDTRGAETWGTTNDHLEELTQKDLEDW